MTRRKYASLHRICINLETALTPFKATSGASGVRASHRPPGAGYRPVGALSRWRARRRRAVSRPRRLGGPSGRMDDAGKQLADYSWPGLQRACTFEPSPPVADRPGCCFPFRSAPALSMASTVLPRLASLVAATALLGAGGKLRRQAKRWRNRPGVSMITDKPEWRKATAGRPAYCVQSAEATNPSAAPRPTRTTAPPDRFCSATGKARAQSKTIGSGRIYIHRFFKLIRLLLVVFRHFGSVIWGCPMPEPSHYPVLTHYLLPHDRCPRPRRLA